MAPPTESTVPTFLDHDPYPSQSRDGNRPASSTSVVTDATSEFGEDFKSAKERQSNLTTVTGVTGPVGEPGLPPSRPMSRGTSVQSSATPRGGLRLSMQPPPSRRGLQVFSKGGGDGSRPNSSLSKTHVPTLTAQGFFRPMSSSKLQAQRNQQPATSTPGQSSGLSTSQSQQDEESKRSRRYSNASVNTLRDAKAASAKAGTGAGDEEVPPLPVSRGTQFTNEHTAAGSVTSATPLQMQRSNNKPTKLEVNGLRSSNTPSSEKAPKSPRSFRASLGIGSRASKQQDQDRRPSPKHHEKLSSNPSSPQTYAQEKNLPTTTRQPSKSSSGKNYEYYAGNMIFFLRGRLLNTRAKPLSVGTFILTLLPAGLFFGFSAPWLWKHVSPALPIIFAYVLFVTISSFLHAAFSDPGTLPRNLHPHPPNPEEDRDPLTVGPAQTEWVMVKTFPSPHRTDAAGAGAAEAGTATTAMEVPTKYCKSCTLWRPPRAHHCRVCDACIETQDHHCVWLNNCVGRRNYRLFFAYVSSASLLALMLLGFSAAHVAIYAQNHHISFSQSLTGRVQERIAFAMMLYSILALPYPGSLFTYHLFLIARGETTREYLNSHKFLKKDRHRPFSQSSWFKNWISVLIRPRPPTYLQFKRRYEEGDVRLGHMRPKGLRKRDLKNRYSVQGSAGNGSAAKLEREGEGVEMKSLPPLPTGTANTASTTLGASQPVKLAAKGAGGGLGAGGGGGGLVDRTPR